MSIPAPDSTAPLSMQVFAYAERHEAERTELGRCVAFVLRRLAAEIRHIETPGAAPLDIDAALSRIAVDMPGWPLGPHAAVDVFTYAIS